MPGHFAPASARVVYSPALNKNSPKSPYFPILLSVLRMPLVISVIAKFHILHCGYLSLTDLPKMNSNRYSPDDLTSDHDEAVAAEQQQPKPAPEKPNAAKPNRAKKKDTDKVTGVTHRKKSPPKETSAHVRRTDSDKVADKVTGKAGGKAKENAAKTTKIGSVKGGLMRAEAKRLIEAAGLTGKRIVKINVVGGHEAPTRAEGTAAQQNLEFVEASHPIMQRMASLRVTCLALMMIRLSM